MTKYDKNVYKAKLKKIDEKLAIIKKNYQKNLDNQESTKRGNQIGFAFRLATELVAGFVVGGIIGWYLDKWLGTLPIFLFLFFALGAAAGVSNIIKTAKKLNNKDQE
jgi:ATP synthase protein I